MRHFKSLPSFKSDASPLRMYVMEKFREGRLETDKTRIKSMLATLSNYAKKVSSINELIFLRSLDTGEKLEPRDKIMATARRVGLSVPQFSDGELDLNAPVYKFDPCLRIYF